MAQNAETVTVREHVGRLRNRLRRADTVRELAQVIHGVLDLLNDELGEEPAAVEIKGNDQQ